jgi:hypothetical protein
MPLALPANAQITLSLYDGPSERRISPIHKESRVVREEGGSV